MVSVRELYSSSGCDLFNFQLDSHPSSLLSLLDSFLNEDGLKGMSAEFVRWKNSDGWISKDATVELGATFQGRCIVGRGSLIRSGAVLRDGAIIGQNVLVGHGVEVKRSFIMSGACLPHMNYVGDSAIGKNVVFGAGAVTANVKLFDCNPIAEDELATAGAIRSGVFVGDGARIGCNVVLNPGSVIGRASVIYPLTSIRGLIGPNLVVKGGSYPDYDIHPLQPRQVK
jgi:NDP-sugar pyrophosphorylase family protein